MNQKYLALNEIATYESIIKKSKEDPDLLLKIAITLERQIGMVENDIDTIACELKHAQDTKEIYTSLLNKINKKIENK